MTMKNKKGFLFFLPMVVLLAIVLIAIVLVVIFSDRISAVTTPIFDFLSKYWWAVGLALITIFYHQQVRAILNTILRWFGIKI